MSTTGSVRGEPSARPPTRNESRDSESKVGPSKPDYFYGDRNKLDDWLNQLGLYFLYHGTTDPNRTLFAASFLRGSAQHYFKPILSPYVQDRRDPRGMFNNYSNFRGYMRNVFSVSNEKSTAARVIQSLRQKTSAADYTAKFKEYAQLTSWEGEALLAMYKRGLKENIKDELARLDEEYDNLEEFAEAAIKIDDRLYERAMEKRHITGNRIIALPGRSGSGKTYDRGDPMELDNTEKRHPRKKGQGPRKSDMKCYACGLPGHIARNCRSKNKVQRKQFNVIQRDEPDHAVMSWTACYDHKCRVHLSEKEGSGWYPTRPTRELNVIHRETEVPKEEVPDMLGSWTQETFGPNSTDPSDDPWTPPTTVTYEESNQDVTEWELEGDDSEPEPIDQQETLTFWVEGPEPVRKIVDFVADNKEVFPNIDGNRYVHPIKFDQMLDSIRSMFWNTPRVEVDYDESNYVVERPPLGSTFNQQGGYVTPDGVLITKTMRDEVWNLKKCYSRVGDVSAHVQNGDWDHQESVKQLSDAVRRYHSSHTLPNTKPVRQWSGQVPPGLQVETQGEVSVSIKDSKIWLRPTLVTAGPLWWEVSLDYSSCEEQLKPPPLKPTKSGKGKAPRV